MEAMGRVRKLLAQRRALKVVPPHDAEAIEVVPQGASPRERRRFTDWDNAFKMTEAEVRFNKGQQVDRRNRVESFIQPYPRTRGLNAVPLSPTERGFRQGDGAVTYSREGAGERWRRANPGVDGVGAVGADDFLSDASAQRHIDRQRKDLEAKLRHVGYKRMYSEGTPMRGKNLQTAEEHLGPWTDLGPFGGARLGSAYTQAHLVAPFFATRKNGNAYRLGEDISPTLRANKEHHLSPHPMARYWAWSA